MNSTMEDEGASDIYPFIHLNSSTRRFLNHLPCVAFARLRSSRTKPTCVSIASVQRLISRMEFRDRLSFSSVEVAEGMYFVGEK